MTAAETWRVRHLGKFKNGAGFPVDMQGDPSNDIAFFKVKHLNVHGLGASIQDTEDTVSEETARTLRATIFPPGTIVFAKIGAALLLGRFSMLGRKACIDNNMAAFIPHKRLLEPDFALLSLSQIDMTTMVQPGPVPSLDTEAFNNFSIQPPDLDTQHIIVKFLHRETARIDQLIEKRERQTDILREREEATFLGAVTGFSRAGPKKASGVEWIGNIPVHWEAPKFTHISRQETGHTPSRKEDAYWVPEDCIIPWFSLADVWQIRQGDRVYVSETAEKISQIGIANSAARLLPANTVILSRTASVGFPAILGVPMATTQDFVGWICGARIKPKYLYYILRAMKPVFRRLMMGSTHQTIYMPDIHSFRTPLPPVSEQDQIVVELDRATSRFRTAAAMITASVAKLREFRAALITAAVTGKIDVATWGKRGTTDRRLDDIEKAVAAPPEREKVRA